MGERHASPTCSCSFYAHEITQEKQKVFDRFMLLGALILLSAFIARPPDRPFDASRFPCKAHERMGINVLHAGGNFSVEVLLPVCFKPLLEFHLKLPRNIRHVQFTMDLSIKGAHLQRGYGRGQPGMLLSPVTPSVVFYCSNALQDVEQPPARRPSLDAGVSPTSYCTIFELTWCSQMPRLCLFPLPNMTHSGSMGGWSMHGEQGPAIMVKMKASTSCMSKTFTLDSIPRKPWYVE